MESRDAYAKFTAALLRSSASGFAGLAASRLVDRELEQGETEVDLPAWKAQMSTLILELAAAVDDGTAEQFADKVAWTRAAFEARGIDSEILVRALEDLQAALQQSLSTQAWAPLPTHFGAARKALETPVTEEARLRSEDELIETLSGEYLDALFAAQRDRAFAVVLDAVQTGKLTALEVLGKVLTLALRKIGHKWHAGQISVGVEHFATQSTSRLIDQLVSLGGPHSTGGRSVMLSMIEGDAHEIGLRLVEAHFELAGWRTVFLGCNTPINDLAVASQQFEPDVVVLGATLNTHREMIGSAVSSLKEARPGMPVIIGGPAFRGYGKDGGMLGADAFALSPAQAVEVCEGLLKA